MNHFLLSIITFLLTISIEVIFYHTHDIKMLLPIEKYFGLFIAIFLFTFIRQNFTRFIFLSLIAALSFFQMGHISFYGMPVYPNAIYLMFAETAEIYGTLKEEFNILILPFFLSFISIISIYFANKKLPPKKSVPFLPLLFITYLVYNPLRTAITGNTWGRQPSTEELMGMNIYLSSSYFLGKILPAKFFKNGPHTQQEKHFDLTQTTPFDGNIVLIIGESLSANHLSLFDYKRKTTPYLDLLNQQNKILAKKAISAGVSTDVSVAFIINNTYGLRGQDDVIKGQQCLFKLAKESGFKTSFFSSQSQQQLRYITNSICLNNVDQYKNLDQLQPNIDDPNAADDLRLLDQIETDLSSKENNFYVLHQRGSHGPYNLRYPADKAIFPITGDYAKDRVNHYDNSVLEFDHFFELLISKLDNIERPTIVIYVSDHGEGLGEENVWGHAALKKPSFSIPFILYKHNLHNNNFQFSNEPTHLEITLFISKLLGHKANINFPLESYQILGNDMDGFSGYLDLEFNKDGSLKKYTRKDI